ncbi:MAG: sigma-70 family RNA polymerase sigma factor [Planctomycetes bacterium]|nr:sigma-70 family RNA polymerase sigma factor [Planctomycetota bacterium]
MSLSQPGNGRFATTHWSVVLAAGKSSPSAHQAMETLCRTYWFPLYAYLRRKGKSAHQAEDLVQAFFARLLEKRDFNSADPHKGKFRSYLLAGLNHFVANQYARDHAQKRCPTQTPISLGALNAENRYELEPSSQLSPEKLFEKQWALTLLDRTLRRLQDEHARADKNQLFDQLKLTLTAAKDAVPYRQIAEKLDMTEGAIKTAVHRLRKRCRQLLREEIAHTVADESQIDEEIRDLFNALGQ